MSKQNLTDRRYTHDHEWAKDNGDGTVLIGITDYAQGHLGDITFVDLPKAGRPVEQFKQCATVESVKAASDVYAPVSGKVTKANDELAAHPELINQSPYEKAWFAVIEIAAPAEKSGLMSAGQYAEYVKGLSA